MVDCPLTIIGALLKEPNGFPLTVKYTLWLPVPVSMLIVIQLALVVAVQAQPFGAVTAKSLVPPAAEKTRVAEGTETVQKS